MRSPAITRMDEEIVERVYEGEAPVAGVSWGSVIGGAVAAIAVSLILVVLGSALQLSSVSPWTNSGTTLEKLGTKTVTALIIMQIIASGLGGYLAGRLRQGWEGGNADETFFRDTAHGFLVWCLATVLTAAFLTSAITSAASGSLRAASTITSGALAGNNNMNALNSGNAIGNGGSDFMGYAIDSLLRPVSLNPANTTNQDVRPEVVRIVVNGVQNNGISDQDRAYLAQLVMAHTGVNPEEANRRVDDLNNQLQTARQKVQDGLENARRVSLRLSMYTFLSMLIGAFVASAAAAYGGKHRDQAMR